MQKILILWYNWKMLAIYLWLSLIKHKAVHKTDNKSINQVYKSNIMKKTLPWAQ